MNEIITINGKAITQKEYRGQRVITFRDVDTVHERPEGTAKRNFAEGRNHMLIGTDFFEISRADVGTDFVQTYGFGKTAPMVADIRKEEE